MKCTHVALASIAVLLAGCAARVGDTHAASGPLVTTTSAGAVSVPAPTVVARLGEFETTDSFDLDRVEKALGSVDASMIVHVSVRGREGARWDPSPPRARVHPAGVEDDPVASESRDGHRTACPRARALSRYGAMLIVKSGIGNTRLDVTRCGVQRDLVGSAAGVVWNVQGDYAVFVTFDGGRYVVDPTILRAGMPAREPSPTPHDAVLSEADIQALTERGAMRGPWAHELAMAGAAWSRCSAPLWAQALPEYEANDGRVADTATKDRRSRQITATYSDVVEEVCAGEQAKYERVLTSALATRALARKRLLGLTNARFATH